MTDTQIPNRRLIQTDDGSHSFFVPELNENYHSTHGARQEAEHIFIKDALKYAAQSRKDLRVLEIGFGTGLNAYLSLVYAQQNDLHIYYQGIEKYPVLEQEYTLLNYASGDELFYKYFLKLHQVGWGRDQKINDSFLLRKDQTDFREMQLPNDFFDVVYFDAFGPEVQADLWAVDIFRNIFQAMKSGGVLTTYSVKGSVRRAMKTVGFRVEKIAGPLGKREISRAIKD